MIQGQVTTEVEQLLHDFLQPRTAHPDAVTASVARLLGTPGLTDTDRVVLHYLESTIALLACNLEHCTLAGEQGYQLAVQVQEYPLAQLITTTLVTAHIQRGRVADAEHVLARAGNLPT